MRFGSEFFGKYERSNGNASTKIINADFNTKSLRIGFRFLIKKEVLGTET